MWGDAQAKIPFSDPVVYLVWQRWLIFEDGTHMGNAKSSDVCWKKQLFKNSLRENKAKKFDIFLLEITSRGGGGGEG